MKATSRLILGAVAWFCLAGAPLANTKAVSGVARIIRENGVKGGLAVPRALGALPEELLKTGENILASTTAIKMIASWTMMPSDLVAIVASLAVKAETACAVCLCLVFDISSWTCR